jgi:Rrf2 family iron-sulfur cluster assembly transcriptional regulator
MMLLPRRALLAIAAVVDVAAHARPIPVAAKALAARHDLPPRHLETLLQALVRANILKGVRGPRGGYELARERRRISAGDIVRAAHADPEAGSEGASKLIDDVIAPIVGEAGKSFLAALDGINVDELCNRALAGKVFPDLTVKADFTI